MTATTDNLKEKYTEMKLETSAQQVLNAAKINEFTNMLTAAGVTPAIDGFPTGFVLSAAQTGAGDSTNVWDYGDTGQFGNNVRTKPLLVRVAATAGATPACTYAINISVDNSTYAIAAWADITDLSTVFTGTFDINATSTLVAYIHPGQVFRYLKVTYSANTNITNTVDVYELG